VPAAGRGAEADLKHLPPSVLCYPFLSGRLPAGLPVYIDGRMHTRIVLSERID